MKSEQSLNHSFFKKKSTLLIAGLSMGLLQLLFTVIYKNRGDKLVETLSDIGLFFRKLVVDWLLIEFLSIVILFYLTNRFYKLIIKHPLTSFRDVTWANVRYLPMVLVSLLLFVPMAILLRHIWRNEFVIDGERLIRQFRHFGRMYGEALLPFLLVGYTFFNINLHLTDNKKKQVGSTSDREVEKGDFLEVINDNGNIPVLMSKILWIEKKNRIYEVKTSENLYQVRKTLSELEQILPPIDFIRINRGVIVNRSYVYNYSFWEYDKFILRMKDDEFTEFIVSRERMRQIKHQLAQTT